MPTFLKINLNNPCSHFLTLQLGIIVSFKINPIFQYLFLLHFWWMGCFRPTVANSLSSSFPCYFLLYISTLLRFICSLKVFSVLGYDSLIRCYLYGLVHSVGLFWLKKLSSTCCPHSISVQF